MVGYGRAVALSDVMPWNEFERRCQDAVGATSPLIGSSTAFVPLQVAVKIDPALGALIRGGASDMELAIGGGWLVKRRAVIAPPGGIELDPFVVGHELTRRSVDARLLCVRTEDDPARIRRTTNEREEVVDFAALNSMQRKPRGLISQNAGPPSTEQLLTTVNVLASSIMQPSVMATELRRDIRQRLLATYETVCQPTFDALEDNGRIARRLFDLIESIVPDDDRWTDNEDLTIASSLFTLVALVVDRGSSESRHAEQTRQLAADLALRPAQRMRPILLARCRQIVHEFRGDDELDATVILSMAVAATGHVALALTDIIPLDAPSLGLDTEIDSVDPVETDTATSVGDGAASLSPFTSDGIGSALPPSEFLPFEMGGHIERVDDLVDPQRAQVMLAAVESLLHVLEPSVTRRRRR